MRRAAMALAPFAVFLLLVSPVFASDVPYSHPPSPNQCSNNWTSVNSAIAGFDSAVGETDTDFTGLTVTSIGFYLCSFPTNMSGGFTGICPVTNSDLVTIGIFDSGTGALVQSFGTVPISSLPCNHVGTETGAEFTFAGTHSLTSSEMVGITFSATQNAVTVLCGATCSSTDAPNGAVVDCVPACSPNTYSGFGFALAGDFLFGGSPPPPPPLSPSTKASAFVGAVFVISMASIVLVAYERPDKTQEAVRYVGPIAVGLAVVFVVLAVAGV